MSDATLEEQLAARDFRIALLEQELAKRPKTVRSGRTNIETVIRRLETRDPETELELTDEVLAQRFAELVAEMRDDGFKLAAQLPGDRLVFERTHQSATDRGFTVHDVMTELAKPQDLRSSIIRRIHERYLPEGYFEAAKQVADAIRPSATSGHLINTAEEAALLMLRVWHKAAAPPKLREAWKRAMKQADRTVDGHRGVIHALLAEGVVPMLDDYMKWLDNE